MFKKRGIFNWEILALALVISVGILVWFNQSQASIPKVGEFPIKLGKAIEEYAYIPAMIDKVMKQINTDTLNDFKNKNHPVFTWKSYCNAIDQQTGQELQPQLDSVYKTRLIGTPQTFSYSRGNLAYNFNCIIGEEELKKFYMQDFNANYGIFRQTRALDFSGIMDFSKLAYSFIFEKVGVPPSFFIKGQTGGLPVPLKIMQDKKEKNIGTLNIDTSFALPVNYRFQDDLGICVLSDACGATCNDVITRYPTTFLTKKGNECRKYHNCFKPADATDDFSQDYGCGSQFLCSANGQSDLCIPFCSKVLQDIIEDSDLSTHCNARACARYMDCSSVSPSFSSTCTTICGGKGKECVGGVQDVNTPKECDDEFEFTDGNDYCICTIAPEKIIPVQDDYTDTCNARCGALGCIMGIDDGSTEKKCNVGFTFEGDDDYCICGLGSQEVVPNPPSDEQHTCNTKCGALGCIMGIDDGNTLRKCGYRFTFEGGQDDDYCICGTGSQEVVPRPPSTETHKCEDKCGSVEKCIIGVDDANTNKRCSETFGFEGGEDDDYCICRDGSKEVIPVPDDYTDKCNARCGALGCISGVDDEDSGNRHKECSDSFTFEGNDDYCFCGTGSSIENPGKTTPDPKCADICRGKEKGCIAGVDDANSVNKNKRCNVAFGFEGNPNDDYCICSLGSKEGGPAGSCGCPDITSFGPPVTNSGKNFPCTGSNCGTLHCQRDGTNDDQDANTKCLANACGTYFTNTCTGVGVTCRCDSPNYACADVCKSYCQPTQAEIDAGKTDDGDANTNCLLNTCTSYVTNTCTAAACGCSSNNACAGACLRYCSNPPKNKVDDNDINTKCKDDVCSKYDDCAISCNDPDDCASTLTCSCDATPTVTGSDRACKGSCLMFCSDAPAKKLNDDDTNTKCKVNACTTYSSCSDASSSCACSSGSACTGACTPKACADAGTGTCKAFACDNYNSCSSTSECTCSNNACTGACTACIGPPTCGSGLTCVASTCVGTCGAGQTKCLSNTQLGPQVVCCNNPS